MGNKSERADKWLSKQKKSSAPADGASSEQAAAASCPRRCTFWMERKNRRCGQMAKPGSSEPALCGNHAVGDGVERVECPHCNSRVVAADLAR